MSITRANVNPANPPVWKEFPIEKVYVDSSYQQPFDENWCNYLVDNWDGNAAGSLLLSVHEDGRAATPDGQHRLAAMRRLGIAYWQCECHYGLTVSQEAGLFRSRNNRKPIHPISKFKARVVEGEKEANEIRNILVKHGAQIAFQNPASAPNYACVGPIEKAYRNGVLDDVIFLIETCWGQHGKIARAQLIVEGMTIFMMNFGLHQNFSLDLALDKFSNPNNDPRKMRLPALKQKAKNDADALGTSQAWQFAKALRDIYNKGGRTRVLPDLKA